MEKDTDFTTYLLTWRTYGSWLPGDERGWVDERRNGRGEPMHGSDLRLEEAARAMMKAAPVILGDAQRRLVDNAIRAVCSAKEWPLHAINVRTNHVHVVVSSPTSGDRAQVALKAAATHLLRARGSMPPGDVLWSRGGSQRRLTHEEALWAAVDYVRNRQ